MEKVLLVEIDKLSKSNVESVRALHVLEWRGRGMRKFKWERHRKGIEKDEKSEGLIPRESFGYMIQIPVCQSRSIWPFLLRQFLHSYTFSVFRVFLLLSSPRQGRTLVRLQCRKIELLSIPPNKPRTKGHSKKKIKGERSSRKKIKVPGRKFTISPGD